MESNYIVYVLWLAVGMVNGWKDKSALNRFSRPYWNKGEGWLYKWKLGPNERRIIATKKKWYYLWKFTPKYKEKFVYSSTVLVFLSDGWHLLQTIQFSIAIVASIIGFSEGTIIEYIKYFVFAYCAFGIGFWITYESKEL